MCLAVGKIGCKFLEFSYHSLHRSVGESYDLYVTSILILEHPESVVAGAESIGIQ